MHRNRRSIWISLLLIQLSGLTVAAQSGAQAGGEVDPRSQQLVEETIARLLSFAGKPTHSYSSWPPPVHVVQAEPGVKMSEGSGDYNAFATAPKCVPYIGITHGLISDIIQYQPDRIAFVLGHELSHLLLGHVPCSDTPPETGLVQNAFTRQQEYDADKNGMMLALRAGYSAHEALMSFRIMDEKLGYSGFEALGVNHPSFKERLAELDTAQASLWRSMGAFQNGAYFLAIEQYAPAEDCFKHVTEEFPDAVEAWVNLGYARLMRYADSLNSEDVKRYQIGQLAVGAFYARPDSLRAKIRGINGELWNDTLEALENANRLNPDAALVHENLGLAYLIHPSGAPQLDKAVPYLEHAATLAEKERALDGESRAAIKINLAVAYAAAGRIQEADVQLSSAQQQLVALKDNPLAQFFGAAAFYYNSAALASNGAGPQVAGTAADKYERYLAMTNRNSAWWPIAYERYQQLSSLAGRVAKPESAFESRLQSVRRPTVALELGSNQRITLGDSLDQVRAMLGTGEEVPVAGRIKQVRYTDKGLVITGDSQVLAIILNDSNSPDLPVRAFGLGQSEEHLRVGMSADEAAQILPNQPYAIVPFLDFQTPYVFFPTMGLALSLTEDKRIRELVIAQIPLQ